MDTQDNVRVSQFGDKEVGAKAIDPLIRIFSWEENNAAIREFMAVSNLPRDYIATNGWGYPAIPIPQYVEGFDRIRNAPPMVSKAFLGHPIYWIDKELTQFRPHENLEEWCIRMFYLIDAFGYWTEKLEFVDFLKVHGFSFSDAQIDTYHIIADENSETDQYRKLDESDLETSLSRVDENFERAAMHCWELKKEQEQRVKTAQKVEYTFAMKVIGEDTLRDWTASYSDPGGMWDTHFEKNLGKIASRYNERALAKNHKVSDLLRAARVSYENLGKVIARFHHAASILELPILATMNYEPGKVELIARMATILKDSNTKDNIRLQVLNEIDEKIKHTLVGANKGVGAFDEVIQLMRTEYGKAWNRMRRAVINYQNYQRGDIILATRVELEAYLQSGNIKGRNIGEDGFYDNDGFNTEDLSSAFDVSFKG